MVGLAVMSVTLVVLLGLARLAAEVVARAEVDAAADAVVLAALVGGAGAADSVAAANAAVVLSLQAEPGWARVTVTRAGRRATSTAALVAQGPRSVQPGWPVPAARASDPDPGSSVP